MCWQKSSLLLIAVLFVSAVVQAQDTGLLKREAEQLRLALMDRDSVTLNRLLHPQATYGHSNGWVQSRSETVADLFNGKLQYTKLNVLNTNRVTLEGNTAILRQEMEVGGKVGSTAFAMKLQVLQTWVWKQRRWQLIARQAAKMPD